MHSSMSSCLGCRSLGCVDSPAPPRRRFGRSLGPSAVSRVSSAATASTASSATSSLPRSLPSSSPPPFSDGSRRRRGGPSSAGGGDRVSYSYDDAEEELRDQGLEVVMIPHRPPPPPAAAKRGNAPSSPLPPPPPPPPRMPREDYDLDSDSDSDSASAASWDPSGPQSPSAEENEVDEEEALERAILVAAMAVAEAAAEEAEASDTPGSFDGPRKQPDLLDDEVGDSAPPLSYPCTPRTREYLEELAVPVLLSPAGREPHAVDPAAAAAPGPGAAAAPDPAESGAGPKKRGGARFFSGRGGRGGKNRRGGDSNPSALRPSGAERSASAETTAAVCGSSVGSAARGKRPPPPKPRGADRRRSNKSAPEGNPANPKHSMQSLGYMQMAKLGYQELVHAIIRPPRANYLPQALGPDEFKFCGAEFARKDFALVNDRGFKLQCSHWRRRDGNENENGDGRQDTETETSAGRDASRGGDDEMREPPSPTLTQLRTDDDDGSSCPDDAPATVRGHKRRRRRPVVIYMHGNSSARVEVLPQMSHLLALGLDVVAFDFAGSGKSEGNHVSLGYYEREDLQTVINHLRSSGEVSTIALWGRSMGAATALMYASRDPTLACMILDSPFTDLTRLSEEMVDRGKEKGVSVPSFVLAVVMRMLKSSVQKQAGFNIKKISPISHADRCFVPAMFVAGENDDFINKRHSELIHERYAGDKNIMIVEGDHNTARPRYLHDAACIFLQSCMHLPVDLELVVPLGMNLMAPPWLFPGNKVASIATGGGGFRCSATAAAACAGGGRAWLPAGTGNRPGAGARRVSAPPARPRAPCTPHPRICDPAQCVPKRDLGGQPDPPECNGGIPSVFSRDEAPIADANVSLEAVAPPDMNERQKDIQASLFKLLGQQEEPTVLSSQSQRLDIGRVRQNQTDVWS